MSGYQRLTPYLFTIYTGWTTKCVKSQPSKMILINRTVLIYIFILWIMNALWIECSYEIISIFNESGANGYWSRCRISISFVWQDHKCSMQVYTWNWNSPSRQVTGNVYYWGKAGRVSRDGGGLWGYLLFWCMFKAVARLALIWTIVVTMHGERVKWL